MKKSNFITASTLFLMSLIFGSCEAIMGIFNAGMGFGIFAVIAVILLIIFVVTRLFGSKNT